MKNLAKTDLDAHNEDEHEELVDSLQIVGVLGVARDQRILGGLGGQNHHQLDQQHSKADRVGDSHTEPGDATRRFGRDLNQERKELVVLIIIIMKNFNRCSSHGHHGSKRCKLSQQAHSHGLYAFTHTLTATQLQLHGAKSQHSYYFSVHAGAFRVSVIHRALTMDYRIFIMRT